MKSEELIAQARARIVWGESSSSVRAFLTSNGIPAFEADSIVHSFLAERNADIRRRGIWKICLGSILVIGALTFFLVSYGIVDLDKMNARSGKAFVGTAIVVALGGLYGVSKLIDGIIYFVRPQSEGKSISEI